MKAYFTTAVALALLSVTVAACKDEKVSFNELEDARGTANANSVWNAQHWRATEPVFQDWDILTRGDSTQSPECPMGDGWATMSFISKDKKQEVKVKCSTVSANLGCMLDSDFKSKSYATEDGQCQRESGKVPYPLPKLAK